MEEVLFGFARFINQVCKQTKSSFEVCEFAWLAQNYSSSSSSNNHSLSVEVCDLSSC